MTDSKPPDTLAAALAAFQADLPTVHKNKTANAGTYSYKYADLADVLAATSGPLGRVGLSFTACPTLRDDRFVLAYSLRHSSGEEVTGEYPLPDPVKVTAQQVGSAISYARRYAYCAAVGVVPDEDDDGKAASEVKAAPRRATRGRPATDEWARPEATTDTEWKAGWVAHVSTATSREQLNELWADLGKARRDQRCATSDAEDLAEVWKERAREVDQPPAADKAPALAAAQQAAWPEVKAVPA